MHALILAAGDGDRLYPHTVDAPKPLLKLHGRPILNYVLDSLFAAGADDATIVVGYRGDQIRGAVENLHPSGMNVRFVENDGYEMGNARSIWAARDVLGGEPGFILAMADHVVEPALFRALVDGAGQRARLAVDFASADDPRAGEATRALVDDGRVVDLGKGLRDWNALDTGSFWCTPATFDAITPDLRDGEAGAVFASVARAGQLEALDVTGMRWLDVDTPGDLRDAADMIGEMYDFGRRGRA
jgi:1L-myo-inositol 1-phosphate cytidylyltransferase